MNNIEIFNLADKQQYLKEVSQWLYSEWDQKRVLNLMILFIGLSIH